MSDALSAKWAEVGSKRKTYTRTDLARAWEEGALWAAVECAAIKSTDERWLTAGDNPYEEEAK